MALEHRLAQLVTFDGELGGFADSGTQGPVTAAAGPEGDDGSIWGYASFEPVAGPVEEGCGGEEAVAVGGSGRDLAFDGGSEVPTMSFIFSWIILNHCTTSRRFPRQARV